MTDAGAIEAATRRLMLALEGLEADRAEVGKQWELQLQRAASAAV